MSVISGSMGAVMGSEATEEAASQSASAQNNATAAQERIYQQQRADFEPYRQVGLGAIPMLQDAVTGTWRPNESPAAKYQLEKGNTALMRALGARGQAGGGGAAIKLADLSKNVAASDYQDQYNRLLDLVKIGTGASSATGAAAQTLSNAYGVGAANLGNIYNQAGANRASLYSGMGNASANTFGTGLRAYQYGQQAGWWGGGSGAAASGAGSSAAGSVGEAELADYYATLA